VRSSLLFTHSYTDASLVLKVGDQDQAVWIRDYAQIRALLSMISGSIYISLSAHQHRLQDWQYFRQDFGTDVCLSWLAMFLPFRDHGCPSSKRVPVVLVDGGSAVPCLIPILHCHGSCIIVDCHVMAWLCRYNLRVDLNLVYLA
jgi:hypothetical protein